LKESEPTLSDMVAAAQQSACKRAEDVLFTSPSDLLAGIGLAMAGTGVTVVGIGVTEAGTGLTVTGIAVPLWQWYRST